MVTAARTPVPGDVADDQGDPRPWQPDRLVPVTADFDELAARQGSGA